MYQQLWGYKVEEKLYLRVREQKRLNTTDLEYGFSQLVSQNCSFYLLHYLYSNLIPQCCPSAIS
jgi:hypothetical protein